MKNSYKPEGMNFQYNGALTKNLLRTPQALIGENRIFEGTVIKCDSSLNLWVDFCGAKCMIPKDEVTYLFPGEVLKDITIISRVGKTVCFVVTGVTRGDYGEEILLLSRRLAQIRCLEEYIDSLMPGDIIDAKVTHMEQFGAFCDIGCGIISLLSVDCISVSRISHPKDRFEVGQPIKAVIKSRTPEGRIYITHRELLGTWEENAAFFTQGQTVAGIVRSVESYGIFVELAPNLAGLAEPKEDIYPSQSAAVYIKSIIPERMKIKLVLIDAKGELPPKKPIEYIGNTYKEEHIDRWQYSPNCSKKVIESVF